MGGRGASQIMQARSFGKHMDVTGFYEPYNIREAEQWHFDKGSFEWQKWNALPAEQRDAIEGYTGIHYTAMNSVLFGKRAPSDMVQRLIDNANAGMKNMRATSDFVVWRGEYPEETVRMLGGSPAQVSDAKFLSSTIGKEVVFKGFMSSAITESYAWAHKGVVVKIKVPTETPGFYVDPVSANMGEKEFLFMSGTRLKVHHITRGKNGVISKLELEVIKEK